MFLAHLAKFRQLNDRDGASRFNEKVMAVAKVLCRFWDSSFVTHPAVTKYQLFQLASFFPLRYKFTPPAVISWISLPHVNSEVIPTKRRVPPEDMPERTPANSRSLRGLVGARQC